MTRVKLQVGVQWISWCFELQLHKEIKDGGGDGEKESWPLLSLSLVDPGAALGQYPRQNCPFVSSMHFCLGSELSYAWSYSASG